MTNALASDVATGHLSADDGVQLYYEASGHGAALIFVHEFGGDYRSYEPQVRYFSRRYRCITYNARGWPPSEVPEQVSSYSQERARDDIRCVLDHFKIGRAHVVGISMGGFATLHFGLRYPQRCQSITVAGCGYGADKGKRAQFHAEVEALATRVRTRGMADAARDYAGSATRVQLQNKDPRGHAEFARQLGEHSALGSANTLLGVLRTRPSLWDLVDDMRAMRVPALIMTGDEDEPCLEPSLLMKRSIPTAALAVLPNTGHTLNLEEPALFNQFLDDFLHQVESGRWQPRDPRSVSQSILGPTR